MILTGLALVLSVLLAWIGVRKGVYIMAATLFNLLISIYVGLLSTPVVLKSSPGLETSGYYAAFCMLGLMGSGFALLQGISYALFLRGADAVFPVLFDRIGGGVCGLAAGYVLAGVLVLAVCMMPFSRLEVVQRFLPWETMETFCSCNTVKVCHVMAAWSLEYLDEAPRQTVEYLVSLGEPKERSEPAGEEGEASGEPGTGAARKPPGLIPESEEGSELKPLDVRL